MFKIRLLSGVGVIICCDSKGPGTNVRSKLGEGSAAHAKPNVRIMDKIISILEYYNI